MSKKTPHPADDTAPRREKKRDEFRRAIIASGGAILSKTKVSGAPYQFVRVLFASQRQGLIQLNPDGSYVIFQAHKAGTPEQLAEHLKGE